ncbi:MAG: hypothetical protein Q4P18_03035 [Methanobrevibacter sp.]|uniref:hypothetical protein n=1 Tax=Methanobrevibacter sp. TaxID=66852 RepID=UPI0026DFEE92|nr:hypothetical protein [Methanobrevibacter sp.]MDO5848486.1 hypothetical protein [Methanobrevibacter sp.]
MNEKQLKYIAVGLYSAIVIIFVLGIITADIYLFVASTALLILSMPIVLKNPDVIAIPKKLHIGSEVAFEKTFYISNIILFYASIAIITLRNTFPKYAITGYVLLIVIAMNCIIFKVIQKNIEKKYIG